MIRKSRTAQRWVERSMTIPSDPADRARLYLADAEHYYQSDLAADATAAALLAVATLLVANSSPAAGR